MAERCTIEGKRPVTVSGWVTRGGNPAPVDPVTGTQFELREGSSGTLEVIDSTSVYYVSGAAVGGTSQLVIFADADLTADGGPGTAGYQRVEFLIDFEDTGAQAATPSTVVGAEVPK